MAWINSKDLGQILIKETTADTNDVFNVLISQGAKGGSAVAEPLINVLNISIPFHHVPRSLNSPSPSLVLSLCHSLSLSLSIQTPFQSRLRLPTSPPPPHKVNLMGLRGLQGCAFMCLNFLWSLCVKRERNQRHR